jgi:hypothetical protein
MSYPPIAPIITSMPLEEAEEDSTYMYQVIGFDENEEAIEYSLLVAPAGMNIDSSTGLIDWTPLNNQIGFHEIIIEASDGLLSINQSFTLEVKAINDKPKIISIPQTIAIEDLAYYYDVDAIDEDNEMLNYSLLSMPEGMSINESDGLISWIPSNSQVGAAKVGISVSDGNLTDFQEFVLNVTNINDMPIINSTPKANAIEDEPYTYDVDAYDIDNDELG